MLSNEKCQSREAKYTHYRLVWDVVDTLLLVKLHIGITLLIVIFLTLFQAAIMQKENGL